MPTPGPRTPIAGDLAPNPQWYAYLTDTAAQLLPLGGFVPMVAAGREPEWLLPADGRSLPVAQYPELFALIGHSFGGSGGSFSLPTIPPLAPSVLWYMRVRP